jgi:hypothetical protein
MIDPYGEHSLCPVMHGTTHRTHLHVCPCLGGAREHRHAGRPVVHALRRKRLRWA